MTMLDDFVRLCNELAPPWDRYRGRVDLLAYISSQATPWPRAKRTGPEQDQPCAN